MFDRFAEQLRKARLKKGASLQQIASITRIDIKFLEAIDNGNFGFLPDLYVKAFIRQYAKAIDLDEDETIKKFEDALAGKYIEDEEPKSLLQQKIEITSQPEQEPDKKIRVFNGSETPSKQKDKTEEYKKMIRISIYAGVIIILLSIVFYNLYNKSSTIIVEERPYKSILEETKDRYQVEEEKIDSVSLIFNTDSLSLQFTNADSVDSAWVMVIYDDLKKEDFLLYPRNSKTVEAADNFKFTLGNSGVIILELNNEMLSFEGKRGAVRHYEINRNGIQRLKSPPVLKLE